MYSLLHGCIYCLIVILASGVSFAEDQQPPNRTGRTITNRDSYTNRNPTIQPRPGEVVPMSPSLTPVVSEDPVTGERTTHVVVEEDYPSEYRTIMIRDPRTGRTIAQRVPSQPFFENVQEIVEHRIKVYQQKLQLSDEEWETVKPPLAKVLELQYSLDPARELRTRNYSSQAKLTDSEPNDLAPDVPTDPKTQITEAKTSLQQAASDPEISDERILQLMTAYIEVRQKYEQELKSAQDILRQTLTIRQQAQLTTEGVLN